MASNAQDGSVAPLLAGVELGGTKCVCILARGPDEVVAQERLPTTDAETTLAAIEAVLDGWRSDHDFAAIGLASFGPLQLVPTAPDFGDLMATTKPGWTGGPLRSRFAARYGLPTGVDTDVGGAALSEGRWGGARGLTTFAYVTVGTGIGVGIVVDGKPVRGISHAEAGHIRVPRLQGDDWAGSCPFHGDCAEGLASGSAIEARTGRRGATLAADDPVWESVTHALAAMAHNLVLTACPQRILFGGGVVGRQPHLLAAIRTKLVDSLAGFGAGRIVAETIEHYLAAPELGDMAGPLGAIAVAQDALSARERENAG